MSPGERPAWLAEACAGDVALQTEVEELLAAHDGLADPDSTPIVFAALPALVERALRPHAGGLGEALPTADGFRVLGALAEGGMGTVYVAEQVKPHRRVALKVLRREAATTEGRLRFEHEAEVLARLEHPGIARVFMFGTTTTPGDPRPFLAMEYVDGKPLSAGAAGPSLAAKVALLAEVAEAVAHAHAKGVVHRDLKPDNILVQENGHPTVVDFGVARFMDDVGLQRTRAGQIMGTLGYMSPEQAVGDTARVDTRSDVYSLGVVGYELLCGRHPLGTREGTFGEIVRRIAEETPPDPATIDRELRGDLSLIMKKALAKEPDARYASASALADDLRRHLRDEPILARPLTGTYQVRRFLRRHKALVASAAGIVAALVVGLALALSFAHGERRQRERADDSVAALELGLAERNIDVAAAALRDNETKAVPEALERVPPSLRHWEWAYLKAAADLSIVRQPRAGATLKHAALGPDAATWIGLATARALEVHSPAGGEATQLPVPAGYVFRAVGLLAGAPFAVAQKGKRISALAPDGRVLVTAELASAGEVRACAGTADGKRFAVGQDGGNGWFRASVFDVATGERLLATNAGLVAPGALAFSPDGDVLAVASEWDGVVRLLRIGAERPMLRVLKGHTGSVGCLAFSGDGTRLATGSVDQTARVWDVADGRVVAQFVGHRGAVFAVAFDARGERVVTAGEDGTVRVWGAASGVLERVLGGYVGPARDARFGPDATTLTSVGDDGLRRWTLAPDADVLRFHRGPEEGNLLPYIYAASFSPDGTRLASGGWDGTVRVVDVRTRALLTTLRFGAGPVLDVRWSRDGRSLVAGGRNLVRWDVASGAERARWSGGDAQCIAMAPDGTHVLTGASDGTLRLHRLEDLEVVTTWRDSRSPLNDVAVEPRGGVMATISDAGWVTVRALANGEQLWRRQVQAAGQFGAAAFSPDGRWLATGGGDDHIRISDARTGEPVRRITGHVVPVYALAWLPDGSRLFSGDSRGLIRVWDPTNGHPCLELRGHGNYVYRLDVAPQGDMIASASGDNTVRLWSPVPRADHERARLATLAETPVAQSEGR